MDLSDAERLRVRQDLALLDALDPLIKEVESHLGELSKSEQWKQQMSLLLRPLGVGMLSAMPILAAVGEFSRFPSAKHLVGYAGLGAHIHSSGQVQRGGRITKGVAAICVS